MPRHMPLTVFLLLNVLLIPVFSMFAPVNSGRSCIDAKSYFAVSEDESNEQNEESEDDFFHVENLEVQQDQQNNKNRLVSVVQSDVSQAVTCPKVANGNCEEGWKNFTRPSGEWCMKIFYENSVTQPAAKERCKAQGALLSGLQNQMESQFVFSTVTAHIYPETGSIWVGLERRAECRDVQWSWNCTQTTSFEWTDKSATGTDGLAWACNQPDNSRNRTQQCATLTASYQGSVLGFQTGQLDDVGCDFDYIKMNKKARDIKAYVCGKKPKA